MVTNFVISFLLLHQPAVGDVSFVSPLLCSGIENYDINYDIYDVDQNVRQKPLHCKNVTISNDQAQMASEVIPGVDITLFPSPILNSSTYGYLVPGTYFEFGFFLLSEVRNIRNMELWMFNSETEEEEVLPLDPDFPRDLFPGEIISSSIAPTLDCETCILHFYFEGDHPETGRQSYLFSSYVQLVSPAHIHGTVVGNGLGNENPSTATSDPSSLSLEGGSDLYATGSGCSLALSERRVEWIFILGIFCLLVAILRYRLRVGPKYLK